MHEVCFHVFYSIFHFQRTCKGVGEGLVQWGQSFNDIQDSSYIFINMRNEISYNPSIRCGKCY